MRTPRPHKFRAATASNRFKGCTVEGCGKYRHGVSRWCGRHGDRARLYGHSLGTAIRQQWIERHFKIVSSFLKEHHEHPGVILATSIVDRIVLSPGEVPERKSNGKDASGRPHSKSPNWHAWNEKRTLLAAGIKPVDLLARVLAVWWFSETDPRKLPDDMRLTYALARVCFKMIERPVATSWWNHNTGRAVKCRREPGAGACRLIGEQLRRELVPFWVNIREALNERANAMLKAATSEREVLRVPFVAILANTSWPPKGSRLEAAMKREKKREKPAASPRGPAAPPRQGTRYISLATGKESFGPPPQ